MPRQSLTARLFTGSRSPPTTSVGLSGARAGSSGLFGRSSEQRRFDTAPVLSSKSAETSPPRLSDRGGESIRGTSSQSPSSPLPDPYLAVGRIVAPHGIRGEVRCAILTDFPERFKQTHQVYLGEGRVPRVLERARLERSRVILKIVGLNSRAEAQLLRGQTIYVAEADAVRLPQGSYFWHQIIGLRVRSGDGRNLGSITAILQTGSNDVYVVQSNGAEILLPAIKDVVRDIDLATGVMTVEWLEGLL